MDQRSRFALVLPLIALALIVVSCVPGGDPSEPGGGDPFCETPLYEPAEREVHALVDRPFLYDIYPVFLEFDSHDVDVIAMSSGALPPGIEADLSQLDVAQAHLTGTPTETGEWTSVWTATVHCDDDDEVSGALTLTIEVVDTCTPLDGPAEIAFEAQLGEGIAEALTVGGGIGNLSYDVTAGALPDEIELDGETHLDPFVGLEGIALEEGLFTATITVTDQCDPPQYVEIPVTIFIGCPILYGQPPLYIAAAEGEPFSSQLNIVGGALPLSYELTGDLPPGATFDDETEIDPFTGFEGAVASAGLWELTLTVTDACNTPQTATVPVTITITSEADGVPPGVYTCGLTAPEALWVDRFVDFGGVTPPYCVGAGESGWEIMSLAPPLFGTLASDPWGAKWGAIPLAGGPAGAGFTARGMFAYGLNGASITSFDGDWGMTVGITSAAIYDACGLDVAAGAENRGILSYCQSSPAQVRGLYYDEVSDFFNTFGGSIGSGQLEGGTPRSSCPLGADGGDVFILTDEGWLYHGDLEDPWTDCTPIAEIGPQPVCVRKEGDIWAASDFTANTITCGQVNDGHDATVSFTVTVGDGPFRLALLPLDGGLTAIGCAGFDDDTWTEIVVDANCQPVSQETGALPGGCEDPGGVAYDPVSGHLIVSNNATDNIAVVDTGRD